MKREKNENSNFDLRVLRVNGYKSYVGSWSRLDSQGEIHVEYRQEMNSGKRVGHIYGRTEKLVQWKIISLSHDHHSVSIQSEKGLILDKALSKFMPATSPAPPLQLAPLHTGAG